MDQRITSSPWLLGFYRAWEAWRIAEAPNTGPFWRHGGLCVCLEDMDGWTPAHDTEISDQFEAAGLSRHYPFGFDEYEDDAHSFAMHLNPTRIAWVQARIADMEPQA